MQSIKSKYTKEAEESLTILSKKVDKQRLERKKLFKENPNSYAYKLIKVKTETFPELGGSAYLRSNFVKSNWFSNTDFGDTSLFYSNAFTTKSIGFLQLFASKYVDYLPTEEELVAEIEREKLFIQQQIENGK